MEDILIRLGNDITIKWSVSIRTDSGEEAYNLADRDLTLIAESQRGRKFVKDFFISDNTLVWTFHGKDQKHLGKYRLILIENDGRVNMLTMDKCNVFNLTSCACESQDNTVIELHTVLERTDTGINVVVLDETVLDYAILS